MSAKQSEHERTSNKLAWRWKLAGGALLLTSFTAQNFFYDRWNAIDSDLRTASLERAIVDKSVLLNQLLYLNAATLQDSGLRASDLRRVAAGEAARKLAYSTSMPVMYNDELASDEKAAWVNRLNARAAAVHNLRDFYEFVDVVNAEYGRFTDALTIQQRHLRTKRALWRELYLFAYLVGSGILLYGLRYE